MFVEFFTFFLQSTCFTSIMGFTKFLLKNSDTDISMYNYNYYYRLSSIDFTISSRYVITKNNPIILENCSLCRSK